MIFKSIKISGIKSFYSESVFEFPQKPGLYFMSGDNKSEPALGSNAAGKSTVWDAVCWTLYGKTVKGQRASDVKSWSGKKPYYTELEFIDESGKGRTIYRSMDPNKLTIDGESVTQEALQEIIALPYDPFLYSIIFGQKSQRFFDKKPGEKLQLFTEILELDRWIDRSKAASDRHKSLKDGRQSIDNTTSNLDGKLSQMKSDLKVHEKNLKNWNRVKKAEMRTHKEEIDNLTKELNSNNKLKSGLQKHLESAKDSLESIIDKRDAAYSSLGRVMNKLDSINKKIGETLGRKDAAKKNYSRFRRFTTVGKDNRCDVCFQPIDAAHYEKRLAVLKREWQAESTAMPSLIKEREDIESRVQKIKKRLTKLDSSVSKSSRELSSIKDDIRRTKTLISELKNNISRIESSMKLKSEESSDFKRAVDDLKSEIKEVKRSRSTLKRISDYSDVDIEAAKYWEKGFREIRLFLITEFLTLFEIESNNYLNKLGMPDWSVSYDVESETKSKTVSKGFSVYIESPHNDKPVSWESWSGGEAQRLSTSSSLGLASMILGKYGVTSNIEVWDEPSSWLSEEGIQDLLDTLRSHSIQENKQVWIVDQRNLGAVNFDGVVNVVKDDRGSFIEWE